MCYTFKSVAIVAIAFAPCALSQAGLVGQKSPDGKIRFQAVEEFQIEGSHRVRLMPIATQHITPDDAKHFPRLEFAQTGIIRGDANHRLVRLDDAGNPSDVILPDDFRAQDAPRRRHRPGPPGHPGLPVKEGQDRRTHRARAFFIFMPGAEPDRLALAFLNRSAVFLNLDEQFAAMEGFVGFLPRFPPEIRLPRAVAGPPRRRRRGI